MASPAHSMSLVTRSSMPSGTMPVYLTLLQFFLNHRRYLRSEDPGRVDKSPAELLTGEPHAHWLELLGYTRFAQN